MLTKEIANNQKRKKGEMIQSDLREEERFEVSAPIGSHVNEKKIVKKSETRGTTEKKIQKKFETIQRRIAGGVEFLKFLSHKVKC